MDQVSIFTSLVDICLLIALAEVASSINSWLKIPKIIGPLVTGIIFGPKLIGGLQIGGRALIEFNERYVKAVAYERDFWQIILNEVDFQVKSDKTGQKVEGEAVR